MTFTDDGQKTVHADPTPRNITPTPGASSRARIIEVATSIPAGEALEALRVAADRAAAHSAAVVGPAPDLDEGSNGVEPIIAEGGQ
jgi:hypothetical protein